MIPRNRELLITKSMEESLLIRAFDQATTLRRPQPGLIIHSDQGGQYFGKTFRKRLDKWKCEQSMAEKENPYQNAHAESLWIGLPKQSFKGRIARRWLL